MAHRMARVAGDVIGVSYAYAATVVGTATVIGITA